MDMADTLPDSAQDDRTFVYSCGPPKMPSQLDLYRVVVVGDQGVGKTSMLQRVLEGMDIKAQLPPPQGMTTKPRYVTFTIDTAKDAVELTTIDTPGQLEDFGKMGSVSFKTSFHLILAVFAINSKASLNFLPTYINAIRARIPNEPAMMLLGLKSDLAREREVTPEMAKAFAERHGLHFSPYFNEISAKHSVLTTLWVTIVAQQCRAYVRRQQERQRLEAESRRREVDTQVDGLTEESTTAATSELSAAQEAPAAGMESSDGLVVDTVQCCSLM